MRFRDEELLPILAVLGQPDEQTSDDRAGQTFLWGNDEQGTSLFIRRSPFQDDYEALCRPDEGFDSEILMVEGNTNTLLKWFEENKNEIVARLMPREDPTNNSITGKEGAESGYSTLVPKNLTEEERTGYIAGLTIALGSVKGASTFKQAKQDLAALLAIAKNLED